jgi:V/A-type H+-transporting ATPase subunit C
MEEYNYGAGRVRALEARFITPEQTARMASASDLEAAFSVLSETPYAQNLPRLKHSFDFEELCGMEPASLRDLMDHLAPGNEIITALFRKYDYRKLKTALRGTFDPAAFADDKDLLAAAEEAQKDFERTKDPQSLDLAVDRRYFAYLKSVCANSPSPLIRELAESMIDLTNIKTLLRTEDKDRLAAALLEPGRIGKDVFLELRGKAPQEIITRLNFTPYFPRIAEGIEAFANDRSFHLLEKLMDNHVIEVFKKAKYISSGVEPLAGFVLAKEAEVRKLRFILICKANHIDSGRIRERLRVSYA